VLKKDESVDDLSRFAKFDEPLLKTQPLAILDNTKLDNENHR
jgi:hypothetical protein